MTIHFVNSDFMAGILLENKTAAETSSKIQALKVKPSIICLNSKVEMKCGEKMRK